MARRNEQLGVLSPSLTNGVREDIPLDADDMGILPKNSLVFSGSGCSFIMHMSTQNHFRGQFQGIQIHIQCFFGPPDIKDDSISPHAFFHLATQVGLCYWGLALWLPFLKHPPHLVLPRSPQKVAAAMGVQPHPVHLDGAMSHGEGKEVSGGRKRNMLYTCT